MPEAARAQLVDYDIDRTDTPLVSTPPPARSPVPWIAAAVAFVILVVVGFIYLRREDPGADVGTTAPVDAPRAAPAPLGGAAEPIELPPLDQTDALVRQMVRLLSSHPRVAAWLATDGLIRNFVVVVENTSNGMTPAGHLRTLRPSGSFRVVERGGRLFADPRNYNRYDDLAGAVASVDAAGTARLYSTIKPRIEEAYAELGYQQSFDAALERSIVALLQVPILEGDVALEVEGAAEYRFADPRIERLTAAQKQLARMGPDNVRTIQAKLRDIATALGIPAERLP